MTATRVLLIILVAAGVAYAAEQPNKRQGSFWDLPVTRDFRPKFVLFSWSAPDGSYRFALIPNRDGNADHRFIDKFNAARIDGIGLEAIEREMAKLPQRSLVTWMKDEPHKLNHANQKIVRRMRKVAAGARIDLQLNEMRYEQPGV